MASYKIEVKRSAAKEVADLPKAHCQRVVSRIQVLGDEPGPYGCEKLTGDDKYRVRQGNYRILFEVDDESKTIAIVKVGNRKKVYR